MWMQTKKVEKMELLHDLLGVKVLAHVRDIDTNYLMATMLRCKTCGTVFSPTGVRKRHWCPNGCNKGANPSDIRMWPRPHLLTFAPSSESRDQGQGECKVRKVVDLHGLSVYEAIETTYDAIQQAWKDGYELITLIHGAPDVRHHMTASILGRGGIKWALRGLLARGEYNEFAYGRRSRRHFIEGGSMTLALRPCPPPL
jgi:hypothetical protein